MNERKTFLDSPLGKDTLLLLRMTGHEALSEPFVFDLELLSDKGAIEPGELLGKTLTIHVEAPPLGGKERLFHGYVTQLTRLGMVGRQYCYGVQLRPWLWFLTRASDCRIFQKKTVPEIVKDVFTKHGFTDVEQALTGTYERCEYRVQYRETDFDFVSRLLEQEGIYYYFRHDKAKHTLVLADGPSAHKPLPGYASIEYARAGHGTDVSSDRIDHWSSVQHVQAGSYALDDYDFEKPTSELKVRLNAPKDHEQNKHELYDYPGGYVTTQVGERYARVRLQEQHAQFDCAHGRGNARGIAPGSTFTLVKFPVQKENAQHLVTSAAYSLTLDGYEGFDDVTAQPFRCDFRALKASVPFRPARRTPRPVIPGLQTARVVGPKGEEIWTDKYGRVKVQFVWDREGKSDENSSCFIRVAQSWAGGSFGTQYVPRIGQEVVVSFLDGDPDRPLITGCVYNGKNAPPFELPAKAAISGVKTDSTKHATGYNELSFDDTQGSELIAIHAQHDMRSTIEHDSTLQAKHDVGVEATNAVGIEAGKDMQLKAGGSVSVEAAKDVHLEAGGKLELVAGQEIRLRTGLAEIVLQASGMISITGTLVSVSGTNILLDSKAKGFARGIIVIPV